MKIPLDINSEYDSLKYAIVGLPNTFNRTGLLPAINKTEAKHFKDGDYPKRANLIAEVHDFAKRLRRHRVKVHYPVPVGGTIDQLTPRDLGFVIGNTFVRSHMAYRIREREEEGIASYLDLFDGETVKAPKDVVLEGGDVLVDSGRILVGVGERTNAAGFRFVKKTFGREYVVHEVRHRMLHLDCAMNILGLGHALVFERGIESVPEALKGYTIIKIPEDEADLLAANVLSISKKTVFSRTVCESTNSLLRDCGYRVVELAFDEVVKTGGSLRCCTLPLVRQSP